jgi:hypothetical protein
MATIRYTKTSFQEPGRVSEELYLSLKSQFTKNPNFKIDSNSETFSEHFSGLLMTLGISFLIAVFCFGAFKDGNPMIVVGGISMTVCFSCGIYLLLEGPSYATYIKKKTEYFNRLEYAIKNTSTYSEFLRSCYNVK